MPSLVNTLRKCHSTVRALMNSWLPISGIGLAACGEAGDLCFLGGEIEACVNGAFADRLTGCQKFAAGTVGERVGPHAQQQLVGGAQLLAGVDAATSASKPLAVQELRPRQIEAEAGRFQPLNGLVVRGLGVLACVEESTRPSLDPECPVGRYGSGSFGEPGEGDRPGIGIANP
jgi:hypothetical protein